MDKIALKRLEKRVKEKARMVTRAPVYIRLATFKDKTEKARLVKYINPLEYEIVIQRQYFIQNQNNPKLLDQIVAHELAHINHPPGSHDRAWKMDCLRFGGMDRCVARGIDKLRIKRLII
jgi:predicted metal-dependent hydrolase